MEQPIRSLVTGGCGFVGRVLVDALRARGDEVRVLDLVESSPWDDVDYRRIDLSDAEAVRGACEDIDVVFHNASLVHTRRNQIDKVWAVNLGGTQHMLEEGHRASVGKFVYVGSASAVYEGHDIENGDETLPYSSSSQAPYADSKIAAEKLVLSQDGQAGMRTCALRPHLIYGPHDNRLIPTMLQRARSGKLKYKVESRGRLSDFTYVDNLVDALLLAEQALGPEGKANGQAYFITNGEPTQFFEFVAILLRLSGLPPVRGTVPYWLAYSAAALKEFIDTLSGGDLNADQGVSRFAVKYLSTHHYFSIDKARRDLGYEPKIGIEEGLERTVSHLRASGAI